MLHYTDKFVKQSYNLFPVICSDPVLSSYLSLVPKSRLTVREQAGYSYLWGQTPLQKY